MAEYNGWLVVIAAHFRIAGCRERDDAKLAQRQSFRRSKRAGGRFAGYRSIGLQFSALAGVEGLHEVACFPGHRSPCLKVEWHGLPRPLAESGNQLCIAFSSVEILIVAKLANVSDTAYGKMIWSLCFIAPQV